jgi:hypothetical protein
MYSSRREKSQVFITIAIIENDFEDLTGQQLIALSISYRVDDRYHHDSISVSRVPDIAEIDDLVGIGFDYQKDLVVSDMSVLLVPPVTEPEACVTLDVIITNQIARFELGLHTDIVSRCLMIYISR